ncbi:sensor histidine kinase [Orrella marina]|nr:ATP-binding protein [Orrella marina]
MRQVPGFCLAVALGWLLSMSAAMAVAQSPASYSDFLRASAYWYDASSEAGLAQARQSTYHAYTGVLSLGYRPGTTWVRLTVAGVGANADQKDLMVRIRPAYVNELTLFDPALDWNPQSTGDAVSDPAFLLRPTSPGFSIPNTPDDRDIYLRLRSTSAHLLDVQVLSPQVFMEVIGAQTFWHGLFFGVVGLILLWSALEWFAKRDALIGRFLLKHLAVTLYCVGYLGYLVFLLPAGLSPDQVFSYSIFVLVLIGLWFHVGVLTDYGLKGWPIRVCQVFYLVPVVSIVLGMLDLMQAGLRAATLTTLVVPCIVFACVLLLPAPMRDSQQGRLYAAQAGSRASVEQFGPLSKQTLVIYYGIILLLLGLGATQVLGFYQGNELILHAFLFHSVISSVLLMTMLLLRARDIEQRQIRATQVAARVQGELLAERLAREEQARMIEMIGHEIKTPLSVLQLSVEEWVREPSERRLADRSIEEIRAVVERSIEGLSETLGAVAFEPVDLVQVVREHLSRDADSVFLLCHLPVAASVLGAPLLIERIVSNLVENALKYGDPDQPVTITVRESTHQRFSRSQTGFELLVSNAVGIAGKPDPANVFRKYYRAESARHLSGTGLGLYLVETFAHLQHGAIEYRPGQTHVEFALWLPASTS